MPWPPGQVTPHPSDKLWTKHPPPTGQKSACGPPLPEDNFWNSPIYPVDGWLCSWNAVCLVAATPKPKRPEVIPEWTFPKHLRKYWSTGCIKTCGRKDSTWHQLGSLEATTWCIQVQNQQINLLMSKLMFFRIYCMQKLKYAWSCLLILAYFFFFFYHAINASWL